MNMRLTGARLIIFCVSLVWGLCGTAQAQIEQVLEIPADNQIVSGILPISGWAFSAASTDPVTVRLLIDGTDRGIIPCCVAREDVAEMHGAQALNSGFGLAFNFGLLEGEGEGDEANPSDGIHTIRIEAEDAVGNTSIQEHTITVVRPGGFEFITEPSLLGATSEGISIDGQEIEILNVNVTGTDPNAPVAQGTLRLAWQPNIQQLTVIGWRTLSELPRVGGEDDDEPDDTASQPDDGGPITAVLENPPGQTVAIQVTAGGIGTVSGWAFSKNPDATIAQITLRVDGDVPTSVSENIPCCSERTDVPAIFPQAPPETGFGALVNFNRLESGQRTVGVEIRDNADPAGSRIIDHTVSLVRLGDAEVLDLFELSTEETEESAASNIRLTGNLLVLENVKIRAKGSDETMQINAGFRWEESCQCFVPFPLCSNGSRDFGEECDMTAFGGLTCESLGFGSGDLSCNEVCGLDTSGCGEGGEGEESGASVYVTTVNDDAVYVIGTRTNRITKVIPVGDRPRGIAISPDGTEAYVANAGDNNVSVIDTAQKTVVATIPAGAEPQGVAFAPNGKKAYVVNVKGDNVAVLDTVTHTREKIIPVGRQPQWIAVTPNGLWAYVTNFGSHSVTVIDLTTQTPLPKPIVVRRGPVGVAASPDGTRVYVTNFGDIEPEDFEDNGHTVSVIDTATNTVVDTDPDLPGVNPLLVDIQPVGVAFVPDSALDIVKNAGPDAFVTNFLSATVSAIKDDTVDRSFGVAFNPNFNAVNNEPYGIAITPNGLRGYVALFGARTDEGEVVHVFSTLLQAPVAFIEVGDKPFAIAIGPQ